MTQESQDPFSLWTFGLPTSSEFVHHVVQMPDQTRDADLQLLLKICDAEMPLLRLVLLLLLPICVLVAGVLLFDE